MSATQIAPFFTDPTGREHPFDGPAVTIGRAIENDIVVTSRRVSREHARAERHGRRVVLTDLESTNGTFLNDERVLGPMDLRDGDRVSIGDVLLIFHDPESTTLETPFPDLEIDLAAGTVRVDRHAVVLSPKEFSLLAYLYAHRGQVCSKDDIGQAVWPEYREGVFDYQIENLVRRLRARIEPDPNQPLLLRTIRGLGYKLMAREQPE